MIGSNAKKRAGAFSLDLGDERAASHRSPLALAPGSLSAGPIDATALGSPPIANVGKRGVFDRIGDFIGSDQGRAALLRSGAETLRNGLGAGIAAGADYVDDQKERESQQQRWLAETGMKRDQLDMGWFNAGSQDAARQAQADQASAGLVLDSERLRETGRHNRNQEHLTSRGQDVTVRGQDVSRQNTVDTVGASVANNIRSTDASRYGTDAANWRHTTQGAGTRPAGIGSKYVETYPKVDPQPAVDNWGPWNTEAVPGQPQRRVEFQVLPLPATQAEMQPGGVYQTARGIGRWNGRTFEKMQ